VKQPGRRYELAVSAAVVAVFAALWAIEFGVGDPPEPGYMGSAVVVALVATPWVIASQLLWRAWWARTAAGVSTMDGPASVADTFPRELVTSGTRRQTTVSSTIARVPAGCTAATLSPELAASAVSSATPRSRPPK